MKKTIYHDAVLNFGKYKGLDVMKALRADSGYFLWLRESETYLLDEEVSQLVDAWESANKQKASEIRWSASKTRKERGEAEATKRGSNPSFIVTDEIPIAPIKSAFAEAVRGSW